MVKVLLTGANGFIAAHILKILLERGHSVVGTVRSKAKADQVYSLFPSYKTALSFAYVPNIEAPGCWDEVIKSTAFDYVVHTASPYSTDVAGKDLLNPAIDGTKAILKAVKEYGSTVKRVVITGSFVSIVDISKGVWPEKVYTEEDWNPVTYQQALAGPWIITYLASKKFADEAGWEYLKNEKPTFDITVLAPPMVFGPVVHYVDSLENPNMSTRYIWNLVNGAQTTVPPTGFWLYVDVRDLALAHVLALEKPEAGNQRILVTAGNYSFQKLVNIIRRELPEIQDQVPEGNPDEEFPEGGVYQGDNSKSIRILGINYRSTEDTILDTVKDLLAIDKRLKSERKFKQENQSIL